MWRSSVKRDLFRSYIVVNTFRRRFTSSFLLEWRRERFFFTFEYIGRKSLPIPSTLDACEKSSRLATLLCHRLFERSCKNDTEETVENPQQKSRVRGSICTRMQRDSMNTQKNTKQGKTESGEERSTSFLSVLDSLSRMEIFFIMGRRLTIIVERLIFKHIFPQRVYEWRRETPSVFCGKRSSRNKSSWPFIARIDRI